MVDVNTVEKIKNKFNLINMLGNVAEMSQKGIAKGCRWMDNMDICAIENYLSYTKPEIWLGFRCVCEYK